jgi:hypothetical protein
MHRLIDSLSEYGHFSIVKTTSTFVVGLIAIIILLPSAPAQQKSTPANDPSRITDAIEQHTGSGKKSVGQQTSTLRIPVGDRLDEIFVAHSQWITGMTFRLADEKDRIWGKWEEHHEQTHTFKDREFVTSVVVHTDKRVDWIDFHTSQNRILHFGLTKYGESGPGTKNLDIPSQSRLTGLTLYVDKGNSPAIQRIEALYQAAK